MLLDARINDTLHYLWHGTIQIPYKGTQDCFSDPFKQVITGVKEHGHGITLFPPIDTVSKGANLTLLCIRSIIESWKNRNGYYPTVRRIMPMSVSFYQVYA